ncbi:MAG: DJ-1 family glyoxalase III [Planctomycetota bacterium]
MKRVLVPLADGFEEIETVAIVDILRRAGFEVVLAGVHSGPLRGSRGVQLMPDRTLDETAGQPFDLVALPGGLENARTLREDDRVRRAVRDVLAARGTAAAICAAPWALATFGVLRGRRFTCHPGVAEKLKPLEPCADRVVVEGAIVTSQAPGTAIEFALKLVEILAGPEKAAEVNAGVLARI